MKTKITFLSITFCSLLGFSNDSVAQNLVPNPGFETQTSCPLVSEITKAPPWKTPTFGTPDLFNSTCPSQNSLGRTGIGSSGVYAFSSFPDSREYIEAPLTNTLSAGQLYCVSFWVKRANFRLASNRMGVYFSQDSVHLVQTDPLPFTPVVENPPSNMLSSSGWMQISGSFTASGGEAYIIIGNFSYDVNTDTVVVNSANQSHIAYYYIDDISVTACNVGIEENFSDNNLLHLYPNPASDQLTISLSPLLAIESIKLLSVDGRELKISASDNQHGEEINLNLLNYPAGIYYLSVQTKEGFINKKVIIAR